VPLLTLLAQMSDRDEAAAEFYRRFQSIVATEQGDNFVSRLFGGKLAIVPWPGLQDPAFYSEFASLSGLLEEAEISHPPGGAFLRTLKTLMAQVQSFDWTPIGASVRNNRLAQLSEHLESALILGGVPSTVDPAVLEPLMNLDTDEPIAKDHSRFSLECKTSDHLVSLTAQANALGKPTSTFDELQASLFELLALREDVVQKWLNVNTSRLNQDEVNAVMVQRMFDSTAAGLKADLTLCGLKCKSCHLRCCHLRSHTGNEHDCATDHKCNASCAFSESHRKAEQPCSLPSGHPETQRHRCHEGSHTCAARCALQGRGCTLTCSLDPDHAIDVDHACGSVHLCSSPCALSSVKTSDGAGAQTAACLEPCALPV